MKELDKGHLYQLNQLDSNEDTPDSVVRYVKREGDKYPGNVGHYAGTTLQEVCRAQIAKLKYLTQQSLQIGDKYGVILNQDCIDNERNNIYKLEFRAAIRHNRILVLTEEEKQKIEELPTCLKCGHIKPETHKECHVS